MIRDFDILEESKQKSGQADGDRPFGPDVAVAWNTGGRPGKANEDSWGMANTQNGYLFTVCDGMGGHAGGQEASRIAVKTIIDFCNHDGMPLDLLLENAIVEANRVVFNTAKENPELKGMGTTACVLLLFKDTAYVAHVGDSRIYLFCNKTQTLQRITKDHSYVMEVLVPQYMNDGFSEDDAEKMAETDPKKNLIMRAVGIKNMVEPTVKIFKPAKNDIFLICTDGLTGVVNDTTIESILREDITLYEKAQKLIETARYYGWSDNTTLELIQTSLSSNTTGFLNYNVKLGQQMPKVQKEKKQVAIKVNFDEEEIRKQKKRKKRLTLLIISGIILLSILGTFLAIRRI